MNNEARRLADFERRAEEARVRLVRAVNEYLLNRGINDPHWLGSEFHFAVGSLITEAHAHGYERGKVEVRLAVERTLLDA